jgi:hypothetical protein
MEFDKDLRAQATSADRFNTTGTHVIVYYFGEGDLRTAVALQGLPRNTQKDDRNCGQIRQASTSYDH